MVPLGGETFAVLQDGKRDTYKPALASKFKASIWVSPKGSGRGSLEFGLGLTRRAWGQGGGDGRRTTLTPERPGAWRPRKNTLTRLYKDGNLALGSEVCPPHRDTERRSVVCAYPVSESEDRDSIGRLGRGKVSPTGSSQPFRSLPS